MQSALGVLRNARAGHSGGLQNGTGDSAAVGAGDPALDDHVDAAVTVGGPHPPTAVMSLFESPYAPPQPAPTDGSVQPPPGTTPPYSTADTHSNASDTPLPQSRSRRASLISDAGSAPEYDTALLFEDLG